MIAARCRGPMIALLLAGSAIAQSTTVDELVQQGSERALAHDWPAAIALLDRAVQQAPEHVDALRWRGHARTGAQRYAEALQDLDKAIDLGAQDAWTLYARAMALHHLGQHERALQGYTAALRADPAWVKAYEWRGYTRSLLGDHIGAVADLDQAIAQDPGNAQLFMIRGKAFAALLDFDRAEQDFYKVLDGDSQNADVQAQLGYLKFVTGQRERAQALLERALQLDGNGQVEVRAWLFHHFADRGDATAAKAQLDAVRALPTTTDAEREAARWPQLVVAFLGSEVDGAVLLAKAREFGGPEQERRRCEALLHAGLVHARAGRRPDAIATLARAVAMDTRDAWEWSLARATLRTLLDGDGK